MYDSVDACVICSRVIWIDTDSLLILLEMSKTMPKYKEPLPSKLMNHEIDNNLN